MNTKSISLHNGTEYINKTSNDNVNCETELNWQQQKSLKSKECLLPFMDLSETSVSSSNINDLNVSSTSTFVPKSYAYGRAITEHSHDNETRRFSGEEFCNGEALNMSKRVKEVFSEKENARNNFKRFQQYCSSTNPSTMTSSQQLSSSQMLSDDDIVMVEQKDSSSYSVENKNSDHLLNFNRVNGSLQQGLSDYTSDCVESQLHTPTYFQPVIPQQFRTTFNVAGRTFNVDIRKLDKFPETLLGSSGSRAQFFDSEHDEYFLDRHRNIFEVVLDFYENGGSLRRPDEIPIDIFINEIKFYRFGLDTLKQYLQEEGILVESKIKPLPKGKVRQFIWNLFEDHTDSCLGKSVTLISAIVIAISVTVFCLETIPSFETLGNHLSSKFEPSFNLCESYADKHLGTNRLYFDIFHKFLQGDGMNDLFEQLNVTLTFCSSNDNAKLANIYVYKRCLIEIISEKRNLGSLLNETKYGKDIPPETNRPHSKTRRRLRHQQEINLDSNDLDKCKPEKNKTQTDLRRCKLLNVTKNDTETLLVKLFTKNIEIVRHICPLVDKKSRLSPVYWLVLEAKLGSLAGILFLTESACIIWFLIELGLRFFACPNKIKFCKDFLNIVDTLAILPYFITLIVMSFETKVHMRPQTATILRTIRLVRMLRVLKLSRYSRGFRILGLTLIRSTRVLFLLVGFEVVLAVTFSSIAYFVEYDAPGTQFLSIPDAFWWALITMTTVGYGDVAPITLFGKITGACCAIMGILCISFPVPVIVSNFNYLYNLDKDDCKLVPEDLMTDTWNSDKHNNVDKFQENLFNAVRKAANSEEPSPSHSASVMWNNVRRQTRKMSVVSVEVKSEKGKLSRSHSGNYVQESSSFLLSPMLTERSLANSPVNV